MSWHTSHTIPIPGSNLVRAMIEVPVVPRWCFSHLQCVGVWWVNSFSHCIRWMAGFGERNPPECYLSVKLFSFLMACFILRPCMSVFQRGFVIIPNHSISGVSQLYCRFKGRNIAWCATWGLGREWCNWICKAPTDIAAAVQKCFLPPLCSKQALLISYATEDKWKGRQAHEPGWEGRGASII